MQVCGENGVEIIDGVLSNDHVNMFVSIPPKLSVSDLMRKMKGRSSHKVQREFPQLKKRYWGRHFWGRGYFSTTNGAITEDIVLQYLENHGNKSTDASR
jgi:putative transposase